ncbi:MAG: hypothetical protein GTO03_12955, partial [Planctomycetales bacterium]|nr:hypothetical protein [Planctomycetales bacterium]
MTPAPPLVVMQLGQAVFTSARTARSNGYQLVARSRGLDPRDAAALVRWGPSHDSLAASATRSMNFFPLPSGAHGLSLTVADGDEHSRRGGRRCYTHCLVCPAEDLESVSGNPWVIWEAADREGAFLGRDFWSDSLPPLPLTVSADPARVPREVPPELLRALATGRCGVVGVEDPEALVADVLAALAPCQRPACSFTTGLRHSPQRPFRLMCLEEDPHI